MDITRSSRSILNDKLLFPGNERLQERLYPEANLRHRHGRGSDDSFDFVNVNNEMSSKQINTADAKNSTASDSSIYHQKTMLSDCDG